MTENKISNVNSLNHILNVINSVKEFNEIIKKKDCYFIDENPDTTYYFCACTNDKNYLICKNCAESCHKDHEPKIKIIGRYECGCGLNSHIVSEDQIIFYEYSKKLNECCFYNNFLEYSIHKKYVKLKNGKNVCSICYQLQCDYVKKNQDSNLIKKFPEKKIEKIENLNENNFLSKYKINNLKIIEFSKSNKNEIENKYLSTNSYFHSHENLVMQDILIEKNNVELSDNLLLERVKLDKSKSDYFEGCQCQSHHSLNSVIKIKLEKLFIKNISKHLLNFNFNIFYANKKLKKIFSDYFIELLKENNKNVELQLKFYSQYLNFTLLFIYMGFMKFSTSNKYLHTKNIFAENKFKLSEILFILSNTFEHLKSIDGEESCEKYFEKKINLAYMIFDLYIKSHFKNFNNLINFSSLSNFNILQRFIYLHEAKDFYKFYSNFIEKDQENIFEFFNGNHQNFINFVNSFIKIIVENLESVIWVLTYKNLKNINYLINLCLKPIIKMLKFFIKYNLIEKDSKLQIIRLIEEIMLFENNKYVESIENLNLLLSKYNQKDKEISGKNREEILNSLGEEDRHKVEKCKHEIDEFKKHKDYIFSLIKSVYFFILYENDKLIIKNIKNIKENLNLDTSNYAFENENVKMICRILTTSMHFLTESFYKNVDQEKIHSQKKRILKTDIYLKYIFEILIGNNKYYLKSFDYFYGDFDKKFDYIFCFDFKNKNDSVYRELINSDLLQKSLYNVNLPKENYNYNTKDNKNTNINYPLVHLDILFSNKDKYKEIKKIINIDLYKKFSEINIELGILNRNFYTYECSYKQYINKLNLVFYNFQNLILSFFKEEDTLNRDNGGISNDNLKKKNNSIRSSFDETKFNLQLVRYLKDLIIKNLKEDKEILEFENFDYKILFKIIHKERKFRDLKYLIGYTDFFNNLNEFFDIYSNSLNFKEEIGDVKISNSNIKFLINFVIYISKNNVENISLIFSLDPKSLIKTYSNHKKNLTTFLKCISHILIKNNCFVNFNFIKIYIIKLLKLIKIEMDKDMSIDDFISFNKILKYFSPFILKFDMFNTEIIDIFELIFEKIHLFKDNNKEKMKLKLFFKYLSKKNNQINNEKVNSPENTKKIINQERKTNLIIDNNELENNDSFKYNNNLDFSHINFEKNISKLFYRIMDMFI